MELPALMFIDKKRSRDLSPVPARLQLSQPKPFKRIGKYLSSSDSGDYSDKWREDFSHRPSWCDAGMALHQIAKGKARGNRPALYLRSFLQKALFALGRCVQKYALETLVLGCLLFGVCCAGLQNVHIETDIVKLWVSQGGRLDEELNFLSRVRRQTEKTTEKAISARDNAAEVPRENGLGGGFQVVIQTPQVDGKNILNKHDLLKHVQIMTEIANYRVDMYGVNWTLADICFKPPSPNMDNGPLGAIVSSLLDRIIPCIWITPIDCFWEGSKPLGPFPPIPISEDVSAFISSLPQGNVSWKNLDPTAVLEEVDQLFDLGSITDLFKRAGVGSAYLKRPCIEPLDPECPKSAPNGYDICLAVHKMVAWNETLPSVDKIYLKEAPLPEKKDAGGSDFIESLLGKRKKRHVDVTSLPQPVLTEHEHSISDDNYYDYNDADYYDAIDTNASQKEEEKQDIVCLKYGQSLREWMLSNEKRWDEFLPRYEQPVYPDYGKIMTGGCQGFARNIMSWPEDLIIGGVKRRKRMVVGAEALQSVFLVAGAHDVYLRWKDPKPELKPDLDVQNWQPGRSGAVVAAWQRNFTQKLYAHVWNGVEKRQVHPLASTSIADMLEEFSQFKFRIIVVGYLFMLCYAGLSLMKTRNCQPQVESCAGLGFAGVFLVTLASVAGLGMSTWLGIEFNAATTQIVPFLTLGLGVDDMFLLVHNYQEIVQLVNKNQIGFLMKETGLSVMLTSINNILAFLAGSILPVPALRSFCTQTAILLAFNLIAIVTMYPAMMALDLRRRKSGLKDLLCCVKDDDARQEESVGSGQVIRKRKLHASEEKKHNLPVPGIGVSGPPPYRDLETSNDSSADTDSFFSLNYFLHKFYIPFLSNGYVKIGVLALSVVMVSGGIMGLARTSLGLELSDVLPSGTPPAAFLEAREKYFSFYPMFAVLKGQNIDVPKMQNRIEQYRHTLSESEFVVKVDGRASEEYWMSLLKTWLNSVQSSFDRAVSEGQIENGTGRVKVGTTRLSDGARIGRLLLCSFGDQFNCSLRMTAGIRLVDHSGTINPEGFYNYLTAWYNVDNMMYYVSQASFYPKPPVWRLTTKDQLVPAAKPLAYSQIPFYLTGLVDTPATVRAIKDIRSRCEQFTRKGLANFPTGIPFTFWEQYLHLKSNLLWAILVIAGAVLLVITVLLFNPWTAMMVIFVVLLMVLELAGFMGWTGLKLNPVSAVTLITAVGIGVEFTVHVSLSFLTCLGTRNDRMARTLDHMFVPVVHGGLSTLLGIIMLVFSQFQFIKLYFFMVMTALIIIGLINGLALLPVLLSLFGPPCEVSTVDGSSHLTAPTPLRNRSAVNNNNNNNNNNNCTETENGHLGEENQMDQIRVTNTVQFPMPRNHDSLSTINEDPLEIENQMVQVRTEVFCPRGAMGGKSTSTMCLTPRSPQLNPSVVPSNESHQRQTRPYSGQHYRHKQRSAPTSPSIA